MKSGRSGMVDCSIWCSRDIARTAGDSAYTKGGRRKILRSFLDFLWFETELVSFLWRCSPNRTRASPMTLLHSSRARDILLQFGVPSRFLQCPAIEAYNLLRGLPMGSLASRSSMQNLFSVSFRRLCTARDPPIAIFRVWVSTRRRCRTTRCFT